MFTWPVKFAKVTYIAHRRLKLLLFVYFNFLSLSLLLVSWGIGIIRKKNIENSFGSIPSNYVIFLDIVVTVLYYF